MRHERGLSAATAVAHERDGHRELAARRGRLPQIGGFMYRAVGKSMMAGLPRRSARCTRAAAPRDDLGELGRSWVCRPFENAASEVDMTGPRLGGGAGPTSAAIRDVG